MLAVPGGAMSIQLTQLSPAGPFWGQLGHSLPTDQQPECSEKGRVSGEGHVLRWRGDKYWGRCAFSVVTFVRQQASHADDKILLLWLDFEAFQGRDPALFISVSLVHLFIHPSITLPSIY